MSQQSIFQRFLKVFKKPEQETLRETIEDLIEDSDDFEPSIAKGERQLLSNILNLGDLTAYDVMIPRADIIAIQSTLTPEDVSALLVKNGLSRIPVYRDNLDNILGSIHIKDILSWVNSKKDLSLKPLTREVLFISPAMRTLDLLLQMRETGIKMAVVVDEYGGVDGLITFDDLMEVIIGDIQDAHNQHTTTIAVMKQDDGSIVTDSRASLEDINKILDSNLKINDMEEDIDTIGGLVIFLAGRVPSRSELIKHPNGIEFEVLDADPRRVKKIAIRHISS